MNDIKEKVFKIIADSLVLEPEDLQISSRLFDDLGMDSLDFLDIVFALEKEFQIKLRNEEFEKLAQVDDSIDGDEQEGYLPLEEIDMLSQWIPELAKLPDKDKVGWIMGL